jgi:hypothetical protein
MSTFLTSPLLTAMAHETNQARLDLVSRCLLLFTLDVYSKPKRLESGEAQRK